ncbi:MAG: UbiA family prenyltransferase [Desulfurococcales archaeon]|nr:UbiA family prenyltransferase [Desulfurococcales archaeon]
MKRIYACLRLMRIVNSVMVGFAVLVALAIATGRDFFRFKTLDYIAGFLVGFTISASAMVLNDIADIEIDKINTPNRPLPSGIISIRQAFICYFVLVSIGIMASLRAGLDSLAVVIAAVIVSALYDLRLKASGFMGNVAVAFSTSLPFLYAFTFTNNPNYTVLVFWAMVFLSVLAREIVKDIADVEGDKVKGVKSLPILIGERKAAFIAGMFNLLAVLLSPIPVVYGLVNEAVYSGFVIIVDFALIYSSYRVIINPSREEALRQKRIMLYAMMIGLMGFVLSVLV